MLCWESSCNRDFNVLPVFQSRELDLSAYEQPSDGKVDLKLRTFKTKDFMEKFEGQLTPAGLAFFQSDYDSSVKKVCIVELLEHFYWKKND